MPGRQRIFPSQGSNGVALDATLWDEPTTGIGLYTHELARGLEARGISLRTLGAERSGTEPRHLRSRTAYTLAELPVVLQRHRPALFHALGNFNLPLLKPAGVRFVLTIHDLIPELLPQTVSTPFRLQFKLLVTRALDLADAVDCVSEATRSDLLRLHPTTDPSRLHVIHNGVDHVLRSVAGPDDRRFLEGLALPPEFVLYAGAWDLRKNLRLLLDAWKGLPVSRRPPLLLAGQSWYAASGAEGEVRKLEAAGLDVRRLGFVSAPVLYDLMRRASVFVFPSLYEGFGLPPLEAMRLGTPTIISREGSLPEVCGDAAVQVDAHDSAELTFVLRRLLESQSERGARREAGERWASTFTWERTSKLTAQVYEWLSPEIMASEKSSAGSSPRLTRHR